MKILVVDDDLGSRLVTQATVEGLGHECRTAEDGEQAWRVFQVFSPDVLVTDRAMPVLDGLELCRRIRATPEGSYTYIVLLTALGRQDQILEGMHAGADDYVSKPLKPFDLQARLLAAARVTALHAELNRAREELLLQARSDPLTGLRNRLGLMENLDDLAARSRRYGRSVSVVMCDVDHFKRYNDDYGHVAGDQALRQVAGALRAGVRDGDRVYRYGGEEFLLLLPEQTEDMARSAVERVLAQVRAMGLEHRHGTAAGVVTLSAGLASSTADRPRSGPELLAAADEALYAAKAAGRNRLHRAPDSGVQPLQLDLTELKPRSGS